MPFEIVGREEASASIEAFVGRGEGGAAALVLEGEAGIGKSTLWLAGVELARSRGLRVLLSRPAEAERGLAHLGLGDLFDDALAFALRRLAASRVLVLLAQRPVAGAEPSGLEGALDAARVERLPVGPLSVGALHRLLHDRLGRPFPRQTLLRIHERSGGNPFFALELARALDMDIDPLEPLPVPERLDELVRARLAGLPAATHAALALASALGTPSESLLERAGVAPGALEAAVAAASSSARTA